MNGRTERSVAPYILGGLAALAVIIGLFYMMSDRNRTVATNERPAVTTTTPATNVPAVRETTGSGASTNRVTEPTGSRPAVPGQVPPPASPGR
jgi:hypothetical protein